MKVAPETKDPRIVDLMRASRAAQGLDPDRITDPAAVVAIARALGGDRRGT